MTSCADTCVKAVSNASAGFTNSVSACSVCGRIAKKVVADLQKRGYQAHTKQENGFTRVIIGPDVSKSKLERQIGELKEITGAKGRLLKFKPLNP